MRILILTYYIKPSLSSTLISSGIRGGDLAGDLDSKYAVRRRQLVVLMKTTCCFNDRKRLKTSVLLRK